MTKLPTERREATRYVLGFTYSSLIGQCAMAVGCLNSIIAAKEKRDIDVHPDALVLAESIKKQLVKLRVELTEKRPCKTKY